MTKVFIRDQVMHLKVEEIIPNPQQPRRSFVEDSMKELCDSVLALGIIQPLVVRVVGNQYELIAGERRLRAAKMANLVTVPVIIKQYNDSEVAQATLIENIQRENLNPLEEAAAYDRLLVEYGYTQEEVAQKVGKSQSTIANKRRLLKLPEAVKEMIGQNLLNERQGRALLKIEQGEAQESIAKSIVTEGLNVRQTEDLIENYLRGLPLVDEKAPVAKPLRKFYVRDVRIFLNSVREAVRIMKKSGFDANVTEVDGQGYYEFVVKIAKEKK
ncbi:MAG: ParB/RepB/Spo0J family partition protein [bacterium]|nr:ParB/RepB/Spo0J family partition protein [bacterium]